MLIDRSAAFVVTLGALVSVALSGCASSRSPLGSLERSMIYQPAAYSEQLDGPAGRGCEDAWFTADGLKLHGWYLDKPNPRAVVLYAHGNAGNITNVRAVIGELNAKYGVAVLAFDYRGYGRSEGTPSEAGVLADARAARAWLAKRAGVTERDVVLMGRSLGGGVVVDLAAEDGARGLILESTFTSLPEVAAKHIHWLPVGWIMQNRLDSLSKIGRYHGPLLQSHGDADQLIPYEMAQRLHAAAPGSKRFITIPGGDHNDPQTPEYYQALDEFIESLPKPAESSKQQP